MTAEVFGLILADKRTEKTIDNRIQDLNSDLKLISIQPFSMSIKLLKL